MKKICVILICLFILLTACNKNSTNNVISALYGVNVDGCEIIREYNNHGFHGDGIQLLEYDCEKNSPQIEEDMSNWNCMPLPESLHLLLYGGEKNNIIYTYNLAEEYDIPIIDNGFYLFVDRHSSSESPNDDSALLNRHSFNFTLILYDSDSKILYYIKYDT